MSGASATQEEWNYTDWQVAKYDADLDDVYGLTEINGVLLATDSAKAIWRSTDGSTWTAVAIADIPFNLLVVGTTVYASSDGGTYRSIDAGRQLDPH